MFKIEVLYKEFANLYGDLGNIKFLENIVEDVSVIYTHLNDKPKFLEEDINLVYLGASTEKSQIYILNKLLDYKKQIKDKIENNLSFLIIGNSLEIFGKYIETIDKKRIEGLGIFDVYAKQIETYRHNSLILGETLNNIKIVGFKNQMSHLYGSDKNYFLNLNLGTGRNKEQKEEGVKYKNFVGTYVIGPILPLNPDFAEFIVKNANGKIKKEANEIIIQAKKAKELRIKEYENLIES